MFFSKQISYLGVDLGAHGIKLVEMKKEKNRPVLFTYGSSFEKKNIHRLFSASERSMDDLAQIKTSPVGKEMKMIENPQAQDSAQVENYASELRAVCKMCKTVSKAATASLPISAVFHTVINLPQMDKKEFDAVLKAEVKKLLPLPIDEMALDYQIINNGSKNQKVIVNAVSKRLVTFYTQVFTKAGLTLEALEPESVALARSLIGRDNAVTMLIDMGAERTNFFIVDQGAPITHHSLTLGGNKIDAILQKALGVKVEEIEQIKMDLFRYYLGNGKNSLEKEKFLNLLHPVLDPVVKQIEYGFDVYLRQAGNEEKRPEKIILTGGAAKIPYLAQFLSDKFQMRCFLGDPWARSVHQEKLKPVLNEIGPRMAVAIGLALRKIV